MKTSCFIILSCLSASVFAEPLKLKSGEFTVRPSFAATLIPEQAVPVSIPAKEWATFTILEIVPHGSYVEKGQVLVRFDDESYLEKLRDAESAAEAGKLTLANAEADFASAEKYLPMQLQSAKIKAADAAEAWDYFRKTRRDADTKEAILSLRQSELRLDSEREEMKQLEKMYKADDLTENTEEIILKRQREMVKAYEVMLDLAKLAHTRQLEVTLPREAVQLEREAQSSAISLKENEQNLPRNLELKRIALEDARISAKRSAQALAALQAEKELFAHKAPVSGYFYYGSMQDGRWTTGDPVKTLVPFSAVAIKRPFAVVVPDKAKLLMEATVEENVLRAIKVDLKGFASMTGRADVSFPVSVVNVAQTPGIDGRYRVSLSAEFSKDMPVVAGMTANVQLTAYQAKSVITVPLAALNASIDGGWEVKLQEAEDKVKQVPVKRGWTWGGKVEILSGLNEGQMIVVPAP
jgi:multidrug efflux pump subunit AcrA (membrane-fusion protein)